MAVFFISVMPPNNLYRDLGDLIFVLSIGIFEPTFLINSTV
jgi:hypothetical protein